MIGTFRTECPPGLEQFKACVEGSTALRFEPPDRQAVYGWEATELRRFAHVQRGKPDKGAYAVVSDQGQQPVESSVDAADYLVSPYRSDLRPERSASRSSPGREPPPMCDC